MFCDLLVGDQLWIVAGCLDDSHPRFSKVGLLSTVQDIFNFDQPTDQPPCWNFEVIYLRAGTRLSVLSSSTSCAF